MVANEGFNRAGIVVFQDMVGKVAVETLQSVATASITPAVSKAMERVQQARKRKAEGSGGGPSGARSDVPVQAPANAMAQARRTVWDVRLRLGSTALMIP